MNGVSRSGDSRQASFIPGLGSSRCSRAPFRLEALAAEYGTALRGLKRNGGFFAARRTVRAGFYPGIVARTGDPQRLGAFGLARLAALRLILELFIVEKKLFPGSEYKVRTAVNAFENFVLEFHRAPFRPLGPRAASKRYTLLPSSQHNSGT